MFIFCFEGYMSKNITQDVALSDVILKLKQVIELTSLSQATIYRYLNDPNSDFPPRKKLGAGRVGWLTSSINNYIASRPDVL
jgi:predicted DNA-binding transcriptional regulator AlpA